MGFGTVVSGGLMLLTLLIVAAITIPAVLTTSSTMAKAYSEKATVENQLLKTSLRIDSIQTSANPDPVTTIRVSNIGSTKLYNYEKFSIIVTYVSAFNSTRGPVVTETLSYDGIAPNSTPQSGQWIINGIAPDSLDPQIWNPGEQMTVKAALSREAFPGGSISAIFSTDVGEGTTISGVIS